MAWCSPDLVGSLEAETLALRNLCAHTTPPRLESVIYPWVATAHQAGVHSFGLKERGERTSYADLSVALQQYVAPSTTCGMTS